MVHDPVGIVHSYYVVPIAMLIVREHETGVMNLVRWYPSELEYVTANIHPLGIEFLAQGAGVRNLDSNRPFPQSIP